MCRNVAVRVIKTVLYLIEKQYIQTKYPTIVVLVLYGRMRY